MSSASRDKMYLPNSSTCFVCGEDNASGLRTLLLRGRGPGKMPLTAGAAPLRLREHGPWWHCLAAALDECMGWAAARAIRLHVCVTAELTVRYIDLVPAPPGFGGGGRR